MACGIPFCDCWHVSTKFETGTRQAVGVLVHVAAAVVVALFDCVLYLVVRQLAVWTCERVVEV